ncbi:calsequestrin-1-like [Saccostrea cucullata]|uniref:calsequestrin-1-like n=1 Tax=Saccostrea cuccullata TaxID=36930 RepID=UPI002ED16773
MTDFCQTPVLKSTATMTEDVVQKSVGTVTDAAVLPLQCNSEDQQDTDSEDSSDEEDEDWLPGDESDDDYDEAIDELDITDHQEDRAHRERKYSL